jgi:hypothetical protein
MDEKVFPAVLLDKTVALLIAELLHFSFWHKIFASCSMIPKKAFTGVFPEFRLYFSPLLDCQPASSILCQL